MKVLALDYGAARTGVAVSDATGTIARPLGVVARAASADGLSEIAALVREHEVERVLVGLPLTLRGERGAQALETEAFVDALRGIVDVPVETYDERFTTVIAAREGGGADEDARAAAHLLESYLASCGRAVSRRLAALSCFGRGGARGQAAWATRLRPAVETTPPLARLRIIFPEGFTRRDMADRVAAVREIAIEKRGVTPRLTRNGLPAASRERSVPPAEFRKDWAGRSIEGFLFPATYEFTKLTSSARLVRDQLRAFRRNWRKVDLRYARSKNLTPYDVLIIASMIEKEAVAPDERRLVAAVIYNRLRNRMPLGIDATIRYGRDVPGTEPLKESDLESNDPYNTRKRLGLPPTPISNPGLASMRAAANPARVDYLYFVRKGESDRHFFTASESEFCQKSLEYGFGGC